MKTLKKIFIKERSRFAYVDENNNGLLLNNYGQAERIGKFSQMDENTFDVKGKDVVSYEFGDRTTTRTLVLFTDEGTVECTVTWSNGVFYGYDSLEELVGEDSDEVVVTNTPEGYVMKINGQLVDADEAYHTATLLGMQDGTVGGTYYL